MQNRTSICCLRLQSRRRRLSLCSLPVPKQSEESLGSCLRRPAGDLRDLAGCTSRDPDVFPFSGKFFYAAAVRLNSPAVTKSVFRLSTASMWATIFLATARVARLLLLAAVLCHRAGPAHRCSAEPAEPPRPAPAGCACSSAWRSVSASSCRPNSSPHCTDRSS